MIFFYGDVTCYAMSILGIVCLTGLSEGTNAVSGFASGKTGLNTRRNFFVKRSEINQIEMIGEKFSAESGVIHDEL